MTAAIDQKAYLQKYLSGSSGEKKKKKKKVSKGTGFKIIDDDLDFSKLRSLEGGELDILDQGEDGPQIAGIIDERPEELKKLDEFKTTSKWRVINQDDGFNSRIKVEEVKRNIKEVEKENEVIFGKMYSDSEDEKKNDSDLSPPRKTDNRHNKNSMSTARKPQNNSDSDFSPPRKNQRNDSSPRRRKDNRSRREQSDSDASPPRKKGNKKYNSDTNPKKSNDASKSRQNRDSDKSPERRKNDKSKPKDSDLDLPHPREQEKSNKRVRKPTRWGDFNETKQRSKSPEIKHHKSRNKNEDSDVSPPTKSRKEYSKSSKSDSDESPPRKRRNSNDIRQRDGRDKHSSHSKRKKSRDRVECVVISSSDSSPPRQHRNHRKDIRNSDSPPPSNKKMAKTLDGKVAGLQDAKELRKENEAFRLREEEVFKKMSNEVSGRNAQVVSRKGKHETSEDRQKQREKAERQQELDEKYKKWSKGMKQVEAQEERVQEFLHESAKPLARYKDDRDLEGRLRGQERAGDPMLQYMRERKRERGELPPEKPTYKGSFPPNRFNIRPGYRWDGVDRSSGYERKYFEQQSKHKAQEEEAYKWSTEDL